MQSYTERIAPSAVSHAVALSFLAADSRNLVVAKTSLLQVFRLLTRPITNTDGTTHTSSQLLLVGEYPLAGTVTALAAVHTLNTKSGGHALLISFKDAKLSLVEWDPDNHRISTVSIHYYEGENVQHAPYGPTLSESESILTVDPRSRCAALKFGARSLAILPFRQLGDDLMEGVEGQEDESAANTLKRTQSGLNDAVDEPNQTLYSSSFVLPLTALDPTLTHPIDLAFLHEYREPTFGILSAPIQPSNALLQVRRDVLSYTVFSLDLDQRASTNLIATPNLPCDLWKVIPLALPVGGALLVGTNELIHVDQSGKTSAVAVNEFADQASNLSMFDQSDLRMKLEGCTISPLDPNTGDMLIVLNTGALAILAFRLQGRAVAGLTVTGVAAESGGMVVEVGPSCAAATTSSTMFVGSEDGDSTLLTWTKPTSQLSKKRSHAQMLGKDNAVDEENSEEEEDDDDLYATAQEPSKRSLSASAGVVSATAYKFRIADCLSSFGPINSIAFGRHSSSTLLSPSGEQGHLQLGAAVGRGRGSRMAIMSKQIVPRVLRTHQSPFEAAQSVWTMRGQVEDGQDDQDDEDDLLFVFNGERTRVYSIIAAGDSEPSYQQRTGTEFEYDGETLSVFTVAGGSRVVQVRRSEIRTYDSTDFTLSQIIPMMDDETDAELTVVHTHLLDPYVLIIRDDSSVLLLQIDGGGDVEPLDPSPHISLNKWLSGCLYTGQLHPGGPALCLLDASSALHILSLPNLEPIYHAPTLPHLPAILSTGSQQRRTGTRETLTELLLADIGTTDSAQPYLIVRSALDDLTLYEPWWPLHDSPSADGLPKNVRFRKVPFEYSPRFADATSDGRPPPPLRQVKVGDYLAIAIPQGAEVAFLIKERTCLPKAIGLRAQAVKAVVPMRRQGEDRIGILQHSPTPSLPNDDADTNDKSTAVLHECNFPHDLEFGSGWCVRRKRISLDADDEVRFVAFHDESSVWVVASFKLVDFIVPKDREDGKGDDGITLRPRIPQYTIHLISARTYETISSYELPAYDTVTSLKVLPLEISEHSHEIQHRIVVGTAAIRGEDLPTRGGLHVFTILPVVPDPAKSESGIRLQLISHEETKGAITALDAFPDGLIGTAQGQKLLVRGLKEDGSCLPVAFLDAQCHTISLKHLLHTGMWLAADAWKGLWFGGFTQEPYKLTVLGKSRSRMEIAAAEFLPFEGALFILVIEEGGDLHVLQFDPENPKTLSGTRLLSRGSFHLGEDVTSMTLLPTATPPDSNDSNEKSKEPSNLPAFRVLTTTRSGSVGLVTPLNESTYRRLAALQTLLANILEHAAGLNPRAYRVGGSSAVSAALVSEGGAQGSFVDGGVVRRVWELGAARRADVVGRSGWADGLWGLRADLESVAGGELDFL